MPRPAAVQAVADNDEPEETPPGRIVTVDYEGHVYRFDADTITLDALEDFENQKYIRAIRAILGAEQWADYKARHPRAVELDRFMAALLSAAGALGNPSASPAS
jgi:hypothetical protein